MQCCTHCMFLQQCVAYKVHGNGGSVTESNAVERSIVGLPNDVERRLRVTTPAATTNRSEKRHSGKKKIATFEQVDREKELDVGQKNTAQSTHATHRFITLVSVLF